MGKKTNAFLSQSYQDAWNDYKYTLTGRNAPAWDYVVVTASNTKQAETYQIQIDRRKRMGYLPYSTQYLVVADPKGKRVGSGGATLNVLRSLAENEDYITSIETRKILLIHSGGDSKRIPQYSVCGKLFAPVPRILPDGRRSTIFDEIIIGMSGIVSRVSSGMLVMSGDSILLFNPLQLDLKEADVAALSIKAPVDEGKEHGVFISGDGMFVSEFLHKQPVNVLMESGAVNPDKNVDIDTGTYWFSGKAVLALYDLIAAGQLADGTKCGELISDTAALNFYADFIAPMADNMSLEKYLHEKSECGFTQQLLNCKLKLWESLHDFRIRLLRLSPAKYIHFGTTHELFNLAVNDIGDYTYLDWKKSVCCNRDAETTGACNNSVIFPEADVSPFSYIENCYIEKDTVVGRNVVLSGVTLNGEDIPDGSVLHCIKLLSGKVVCRIYGIEDNPKSSLDGRFLGGTLRSFLRACRCEPSVICKESPGSLWDAEIYPVCNTVSEAVEAALGIWRISHDIPQPLDIEKWLGTERISLRDSFNQADAAAMLDWQDKIESHVRVERCTECLSQRSNMESAIALLERGEVLEREGEFMMRKLPVADLSLKMRIYLALSAVCEKERIKICSKTSGDYEDLCYREVRDAIISDTLLKYPVQSSELHFMGQKSQVCLPVRVNFCGSPSDAAPYCLENGGTMLNCAMTLKGNMPIRATALRIPEKAIVLESIDLKTRRSVTDISEFQQNIEPFDTFALHKAVLIATGVIPTRDEPNLTIEMLTDRLGGGLLLTTNVDVPKGSGLGTSSILAAACCRAINSLLGIDASNEQIYAQVFCAEQLMNTGGGWQDQVGGLTNGLKLIRSRPGISQKLAVEPLNLEPETLRELQERFALIYSGQRRLARNVLRNEMNECIKGKTAAMEILERVREICVLMAFELQRGNVTKFAHYITEQFELVKKLDRGASNTCIEYIFDLCEDLIDGKSICGAGGGGFLQVILKKGVTKEQLSKRIMSEFQDCGVEVWECALI